jgi:Flp pilus assembly protein CpaB
MSTQNPYPSAPQGPSFSVPTQQPEGTKSSKKVKKDKPQKTANPRKDMSAREQARRNGIIAGVLAVLATIGAFFVLRGEPVPPKVFVASANKLIQAGVTVSETQIVAKPVDKADIEPGAVWAGTEARLWDLLKGLDEASVNGAKVSWQVIGKRAMYPVLPGQQLHLRVFSDAISLARPMSESERLVTITVSPERALIGALRPGDLVDVVVAVDPTDETLDETSRLRGAKLIVSGAEIVLVQNGEALRSATSRDGVELPEDPLPTVYVLRVNDEAVWPLVSGDSVGKKLYLVLRSINAALQPVAAPTTTAPTTPTTAVPAGG